MASLEMRPHRYDAARCFLPRAALRQENPSRPPERAKDYTPNTGLDRLFPQIRPAAHLSLGVQHGLEFPLTDRGQNTQVHGIAGM
ncbi:hypothetical protein BGE01nite_38480 [Brevifollis gellanilyticus]|uniref:Uncharacterized protein n=1 Tax=Brevifollis gellanilyticus TaxID=748831 RepID=A0A512MCU9_9BACT|nr:hypothetical protein BGE01nite_38480 [Brevifollis gellanilyticus]